VAIERFPVDETAIVCFARAIGDPNPVYYDPERMIAPPTFVQSSAQFDPDYPLRPNPGDKWFGSGRTASGTQAASSKTTTSDAATTQGVGLHAEQHFEYHRALRPGDVLRGETRRGERWEKQGRSGRLVFSETITEYCDARGDLVVTARSVGVVTERKTS
jgi:hypothetical protein